MGPRDVERQVDGRWFAKKRFPVGSRATVRATGQSGVVTISSRGMSGRVYTELKLDNGNEWSGYPSELTKPA